MSGAGIAAGIAQLDWSALHAQLDARGHAVTPVLLDEAQRRRLIALHEQDDRFRSRVVMQRHGFGRGEYRYFDYPLPPIVQALRAGFYAQLVPLAMRWAAQLGVDRSYPADLEGFLAACRAAGQCKPTPLLLRYAAGDYNCLHRDLYGEQQFPLQIIVQLNAPGEDFSGGELVLVEQRPRAQSIARVVTLPAGAAAIIAVHHRPVAGTRGWYRAQLRHGVSEIRRGQRHTLGVILHDAA
ncbi:2OG-Fe(II) oxygenase [Solimonas terrae]|uniref:2OG-Fe(II) oxygenase n=1 Tax=Solimonas terrae TaxID=1396819 RepID=A0A6M2BVT2_9GAMM|nr:2OG-Fe(II) oxygenase [Solimonas terrae]NGY06752.1 2OG-Fe(II) oxygenase [Solimonas terrae]